MRIGTVISSWVGINRDGDTNVRLLKVSISDPDDTQTVEWAHAAGDDYNPPPGTAVVVLDLGEAWKVAIAADDLIDPSVLPGEREIYSQVAGVKQAILKLYATGIIEALSPLTGAAGNDFVAIASKVLTELQAVKTDFTALKGAYDTHTHLQALPLHPAVPPTGPTAPPAAPAPTPHTPAPVASTNFKADK